MERSTWLTADQRVEIGFEGGLILVMRLAAGEWAKLEAALDAGEGHRDALGPDESTYHMDVSKVCYVKHEAHAGRVGF